MYEVLAQHLTTTTGRPDFLEMFLHHLLTIALYCCSYLTNNQTIGVLVMLLHDIGDIPISFLKFLLETGPKSGAVVLGVVNLFVWPYTRLYVFPQIIAAVNYSDVYNWPDSPHKSKFIEIQTPQ